MITLIDNILTIDTDIDYFRIKLPEELCGLEAVRSFDSYSNGNVTHLRINGALFTISDRTSFEELKSVIKQIKL